MNLLELYIVEIISEEKIHLDEYGELIKVEMKTTCYGREGITRGYYTPAEWEEIKTQGFCWG